MSISISFNQPVFLREIPSTTYEANRVAKAVGRSSPAVDVGGELAPSSFRAAWVQSIRAQIREGTFETTERMDGTVERLLDVLA